MKIFCVSRAPSMLGLVLLGLAAVAPAYAGNTCDLDDGDPMTEPSGGSTADGDDFSLSCGRLNTANGASSTSLGSFSAASGDYAVAVGTSTEASGAKATAIGNETKAQGVGSNAMGSSVTAKGDNSLGVGSWFDANGNGIIDGYIDTDQDGMLDSSAELTTAFGDRGIAIGSGAWAFGDDSTALGVGSFAAANSVAIGRGSRADEANVVSVGNADNQRRIVNVAAGTQTTDAVNLGQLQTEIAATLTTANAYTDTAVAIGGTQANAYTDNRETAIRQDMEAGDAQTLSAANDYTDKKFADLDFSGFNDRFEALDRRMGHLDNRLNRVGALGAAMVGMAASAAAVEGGQTRIGIAAGTYGGKQALSVGVQRRMMGTHAAMTLGGAFSGSESSATVGVGFGF